MAHHAKLTLDGKISDLKFVRYHFERYTEENGKPSTRIRKGQIEIVKDSIYDRGSFTTWLADPDKYKDGEIVIYTDEAQKDKLKTIKFTKGYVVSYEETFSLETGATDAAKTTKTNTIEKFTISCEIVEVNGARFDFLWPESHA